MSTNPHDAGYFYCPYVPLSFTDVVGVGGFFIGETYYPASCNVHEVWAKEMRKAFRKLIRRDKRTLIPGFKTRYDP